MRQHPPLQRPLAGPDDVGGEVLVAPLGQARGDLGVDLGPLAGEDEQLLRVAFERLVEAALDLIGRVDMRPMRRERAVLAVALAGARKRERVVAGEGDPSHAAQATATAGPARPGGSPRSAQPAGARASASRASSAAGGGLDPLRRLGRRCAARLEHEPEDRGGEQRADDRAGQVGPDAAEVVADQGGAEPAGRVEGAAGQRAADHDDEAERGADRQRRPVLEALLRVDGGEDHEDEAEGADRLDDRAGEVAREQAAHVGGAVMGGPALVEQQPLGQQRAEDAAGQLGEHVDRRRRAA